MARKHSSRHHLQPRDLITHQANQTSKPKSFCSFFFRKLLEKRFLGRGGGGANQTSQPKIICFFSWKTFGKMFLEILGIAGPEHGMVWPWQTSALPCNPLACLGISLPWYCLGMAVAAHATSFDVFSLEALGMAIATHAIALAAHGMPWHCLGSPLHGLARQPVACHGSPWLALPRQPVPCLG